MDTITTGAELGRQAKASRTKSAKANLALALAIHTAYERFYEPWNKGAGRPITDKPAEQVAAEGEWADFLRESGYDWDRDARTLRTLSRIGTHHGLLIRYSGNLPNSIDALAAVCTAQLTEDELNGVLADIHIGMTGKDVRELIHTHQSVPQTDDFESESSANDDQGPLPATAPSSRQQGILSKASDLIAEGHSVTPEDRLMVASRNGFVLVLVHVDPATKKTTEVAVITHSDLVDAAISQAHNARPQGITQKEAA